MPQKIYRLDLSSWTVERMIFLISGIFVFGSVLLAIFVNRNLLWFTAFVGVMLINYPLSGYCPMAILVGKFKINRS